MALSNHLAQDVQDFMILHGCRECYASIYIRTPEETI
jgi:hypothetical protein